ESTDAIEEVIVTGYGTQKRSEIVGSVATITGEELMDIPAPNIAGALRNQIAGVGVSEVSGRPGARISLNIRGASTSDRGAAIVAGALRNQSAGVSVSDVSGRPGARISWSSRGASTSDRGAAIGATAGPLYHVDGITVSSEVFDGLDPSMVEDITFLKDASA